MKNPLFFILHFFIIALLWTPAWAQTGHDSALKEKASGWLQQQSIGFTENKGQISDQHGNPNSAVKYLLNMRGLNVQLRAAGFSYDAWVEEPVKKKTKEAASPGYVRKFHRVDIELEGARKNAILVAENPVPGSETHIINKRGRFMNILQYGKVTYKNIYPGIDLEFVSRKGDEKPVEYNFIVHPGADASQIKMKYRSGSDIALKEGKIAMKLSFGTLLEKIPASYTQQDGRSLAVRYKALDELKDLYAFHVPEYDNQKTLVIDPSPSLIWATYFGTNSANFRHFEHPNSLSVDPSGNVLMSGQTGSYTGLATAGAYMTTSDGSIISKEAFCVKFSAAGKKVWSTYVGTDGSPAGNESISSVATDAAGNVFVALHTGVAAPTTAGVHQTAYNGSADPYILKLSPTGSLLWATYIGVTGGIGFPAFMPPALHVLPSGDVLVGGTAADAAPSSSIAFGSGFLQIRQGDNDGYVVKLAGSTGTGIWGTYFGGPGSDGVGNIVSDASGNIYVGGSTSSATGIATGGSFQPNLGGGSDMFIAKLNSDGGGIQWATYYGGAGTETIRDLDCRNNALAVLSYATSPGLATPGTHQEQQRSLLLANFTTSGSRIWATYYPSWSGSNDRAHTALDEQGNSYLVGSSQATTSMEYTTNCAFQPTNTGGDVFIAKFNTSGQRLWGTYYGGFDEEGHDNTFPGYRQQAFAYVGNGEFYIAVATRATNLSTAGADKTVHEGYWDAVLAKFNEGTAPPDAAVTPQVISPLTQTACILGMPALITGNEVSLYNPPGFTSPIFYQWQVADNSSGPWTDFTGEVFKDLQPRPSNTAKYYRRLVLVNNGGCDKKALDTSDVAEVLINSNVSPVANADGPLWYVCDAGNNTVTLNGSATGGSGVFSSYEWFAGDDLTTPAFTGASYTPTVTSATTYTLKITDNAGCSDIDQVTVTPVIANAGRDTIMCEGGSGIQIGTAGIPGTGISYLWSTVSGSPVSTLSCTDCAQPIAKPTAPTTYRLTLTVTRKDGTTCSTTDDIVINFVTAPTGSPGFGGADKTICKGTTTTLGTVNTAGTTWSWAPTAFLSNAGIYNPVFNAGTNSVACPMVYTVTANKTGCAFTDQVEVSVINSEVDWAGQTFACDGWASHKGEKNCVGATYTWELVSGPGEVPTGNRLRNGGADGFLVNTGAVNAVYRRITTVNGISCASANITVTPCGAGDGCPIITIETLSPQGCPKVFGQQELQLYVKGANSADYNYSWTPAGIMDNPNAPVVTITSTGATTVNVTLTNKYTGRTCVAPPIEINNPLWSLPPLNIAPLQYTCPGTGLNIGEPDAGGYAYQWSPADSLDNASLSNPLAAPMGNITFTVIKTDPFSGCRVDSTVRVIVRSIGFDAGNDRTICNGATVTLGTVPTGSYTYSWEPINAAWAPGSGPSDAQPQVLYAGTAPQTFTVTVTDPLTGCTKIDQVTLSNSITDGEYSGGDIGPVCPGDTVRLGRAGEQFANYSWSPATGLSCTDCPNPLLTVTTDQTYTVTVTYPGCSTPVTDEVQVTVHTLPTIDFTDKTICISTPENIGVGGAGNPASFAAAASYSWSPATGLSCTSCASPLASPTATTTYTVTITLTTGCVITDEVTVTSSMLAPSVADVTMCAGGSVLLGGPAVTGVTYTWSVVSGTPNSISPVDASQATATPTDTTIYRLSVTDGTCTVTDDVEVAVKTMAGFNIVGNTVVCAGSVANLNATPVAPNTTWQWAPTTGVASPNSFNTTISPAASTMYRLLQTDMETGCTNYKDVMVSVSPNTLEADGGSVVLCPASSGAMPLTIDPATGSKTIVWSPAAALSDRFAQNPTIAPQASGNYIATVTDNSTNCTDTALVSVTVLANCVAFDYGDVPAIYEGSAPASHGINGQLRIGTSTDAEGGPVSAVMNALAIGDDNNSAINDEEGISFMPALNTASKSLGLIVNNVTNNTGSTAYLVAWIDFNRDGDFSDPGERSQVVSLATSASSVDPVLQFNGFNSGCLVSGGSSYLRVRLTTDMSGDWSINPGPAGARSNGEVEDYSIIIQGADFGDAPLVYPVAKALVNPDLNSDGKPDAAGSVWLGNMVDYMSCELRASPASNGDDMDNGVNDEDGLNMNGSIVASETKEWTVTVNSQGPVNGVQWAMWIDWNADGVFEAFYNGSTNTASPVSIPVSVTAPANMVPNYIVRLGVKTGTAFTATDYSYPITNGEWEDYISPSNNLSVSLRSFSATKENNTASLKWETVSEENSDHFAVLRSSDGLQWDAIGTVTAEGNSAIIKRYGFIDQQPLPGTNYYRLKMVDKDGSFKLSNIRVLHFEVAVNHVGIYPNPAREVANLVFSKEPGGAVMVRLWNGHGQLIKTFHLANPARSQKLELPVLPKGIYHVMVNGKHINEHIKLMIQ